ncbi:MAG: response regulator transcription factor [Chitinophagaceae bacterium]|nr:response regulator transcription factor [Chitinophagaceae bacterium]
MIRTLIVDDDQPNVNLLSNMLKRYCPKLEIIDTANNIEDGIEKIIHHQPDLLFLDIEIHNHTAFDILNSINHKEMIVILITAFERYALQAFKYTILDYLMKPVQITELVTAVNKAEQLLEDKNFIRSNERKNDGLRYIALPEKNHMNLTQLKDIIRIEAMGSYTKIYIQNGGQYTTSKPMKDLEGKLPGDMFLRVHHSHIINLNYISKYLKTKNGSIILTDNSEVPISANRKKEVNERIVF